MQQAHHVEEEIDVKDILRVLWKRKALIVAGTFLVTAAACGISYLLPKVYAVTAIIEPGKRPISNQNGQIIEEKVMESPEAIKETVLGGAFDENIRKKLQIPVEAYPKILVVVPKNTDLVKISIESVEPQKALSVLTEVVSKIRLDIAEKIEQEKNLIQTDIKLAQVDYQGKLEQAKLLEKQIAESRGKIKDLEFARKKAMASRASDAMAVLLYSNEIQNNQIYLNGLNLKLKDLETQSQASQLNVERLQLRLAGIKATKIYKDPGVYPEPVRPKKVLIVSLVFLMGLMGMTLLAFLIEYVKGPEIVEEEATKGA